MAPVDQQNAKELKPLKTLEELFEWKPSTDHIDEIVNGKALRPRYPPCSPEQLKTLICHDMKGGYLDDRFYSGTCNDDSYRFYHWSGVDMFVYFSHNLVTIPPACWVTAAHLHGVKVLGTFITEWKEGKEICHEFLASENSVKRVVSQLIEIARYHKFEGWLINIENEIEPEKVDDLVLFVKELTLSMKEVSPESVVLWYDSVTKEGKLKWQNELNDENRLFFDACDGIFLNYTWTNDHLHRSYEAAANRNSDVFVGLDVFGRNFYEGGKFNTHKALELARKNNLSAAIFAQGWTHETQENFEEAEDKLWQSLSPFLFHHGPKFLPFQTSFCQGIGKKKFVSGKCQEKSSWYNLSGQEYQPIWPHEGGAIMKHITDEAFNGGGCLEISTSVPSTTRLFVCEIEWKKALHIAVVYKWRKTAVPLSLVLHLRRNSEEKNLNDQRTLLLPLEGRDAVEVESKPGAVIPKEFQCNIENVINDEIECWASRTYRIAGEGIILQGIDMKIDGTSSLLLGMIDICDRGQR